MGLMEPKVLNVNNFECRIGVVVGRCMLEGSCIGLREHGTHIGLKGNGMHIEVKGIGMSIGLRAIGMRIGMIVGRETFCSLSMMAICSRECRSQRR